jgi:O-succinylbenzoate synthase
VPVTIDVRRVTVHLIELPFVHPFRTAYGTISGRRTIVVRIEDRDGAVGWGEAPVPQLPQYTPDTAETAWFALTHLLVPLVLGRPFDDPAELASAWRGYQGHHYPKHALESAAWTLASEKLGRSLSDLLEGTRDSVPVGESFEIKETIPALLREIDARLAEGFVRIKVKIRPGWDIAPLRAITEAFPGVPVMADGNCGYAPEDEPGPWPELDGLGLSMIEQPFPADALVEMADLQSTLSTPLCLDEGATSPGLTAAALRLGSARIVNVKPARLGGVLSSVAVHDLCLRRGVPVWCGGLLETGIGRGVNLAIASLPGFTQPADMSPSRIFYTEDLVDPTYDIRPDGTIAVPKQPGVGFNVSEDRIGKYEVQRWDSPG